jgi:hypothetical protein
MGSRRPAQGGTTLATISLAGGFFFPTTGVRTDGKAMLLAIDDASLTLKRNLCIYITKPTVRKEAVLAPSRDNPNAVDYLAAHFLGSVLFDEGKFRMWYYPCSLGPNPDMPPEMAARLKDWPHKLYQGPPCYAESADGIHWAKPNLGQVLFKGSRDNNALSLPEAAITGVNVMRDDEDPDPQRRYKMVYEVLLGEINYTLRTATSPDGIHWTAGARFATGPAFMEQTSLFKYNGLYFVNGHSGVLDEGGRPRGRTGVAFVSPDFEHWLPEGALSFGLPEPAVAGIPVEQGRRDEVHQGCGAAPFGNVLVGLYGLWHNDDDFFSISGDLGLVVSNDGLLFREPVKGYKWLRSDESPAPAVEGKRWPTILCQGGGIVNVADETRIYHGRWRNANYVSADAATEVALATIPRDRWGALGLVPDAAEGSVWSCPVTLPEDGCQVVLNADGADGMRVEVADERFGAIAHFSGDASGTPATPSGLDVPVVWPAGGLQSLGGRTVRFRIHVRKAGATDPRLYAAYLTAADRGNAQ